MRLSFLASLLVLFALPSAAHADTIINASSTGWCDSSSSCDTSSLNGGIANNDASTDYNDFFTFSIPTGETITSATLNIWASDAYGVGHDGSGTYTLDQATGLSFSGLGSGTVLGSIDGASVSAGSAGMFDSITINAAGLADLNSAEGSGFSIGGTVGGSTLDVWGYTSGTPVAFLDLTTSPAATPEPSSLALLGTGLLAGISAFRRKLKC
jgi:hypothetical protein